MVPIVSIEDRILASNASSDAPLALSASIGGGILESDASDENEILASASSASVEGIGRLPPMSSVQGGNIELPAVKSIESGSIIGKHSQSLAMSKSR